MGAMYMLAAGTVGESREQIINILGFGDALTTNDPNDVKKPFQAYSNMLESIKKQPDKGYILDIGKLFSLHC